MSLLFLGPVGLNLIDINAFEHVASPTSYAKSTDEVVNFWLGLWAHLAIALIWALVLEMINLIPLFSL